MTFQKPRPLETLQQVMSAFKSFEKKLDKLQDDVNYHGQTLTDIRIMVGNLTTPDHKINQDGKNEIPKGPSRKNTAIQYEFEEPLKVKRKTAIQPLPNKIKAKSYQAPKYGLGMSGIVDASFITKIPSSPKALKHSPRLSKADAPRKATTLRSQKNKVEKRRSKPKNPN